MPHSLLAMLIVVVTATTVAAQQTPPEQNGPKDAIAAAAAPPLPDEGGLVDKAKRWAEDHQIAERITGDVEGWYPRFGGMTRGGGFAIGPGYRIHLHDIVFDASAAISHKTYKAVDLKARWLQAAGERLEVWTKYRYEDFPQEDFFGVGSNSLEVNRVSYGFRSHNVSADFIYRPIRWVRTGATLGYTSPVIGSGHDSSYPSIEAIFEDANAPGLVEQPDFVHTTFFVDVDYRDQPGNPASGGFYHTSFGLWNDHTLDRYDFRRFDANLWQHVPLTSTKRHIVTGHFGFSYTNNPDGQRVPFYFLPYVGGVDTVRSFREFRFKDENAIWMSGEYRWVAWKNVSLAAFIDAGKVAHDWEDASLSDLKKGYGFGVRVHTRKATFARLDFATGGSEGLHTFLKLGAGF